MPKVLFSLLISFVFGWHANAQSVQETYVKAKAFSAGGQYEDALKLYKRLLFFTEENDSLKPFIYAYAAEAFLATGQYAKAAENYSNALYLIKNDSLVHHYRIQKIKALLLQHDYKNAQNELKQIDTFNFPHLKRSVYFYTGIYYFGLEDYDSAEKYFHKIINNDTQRQRQLNSLFRKNKRIKYTNRTFAAIMSGIVPGSGQVYAGEADRGINSFLLTSAFAILGYNTYAAYGLLEAVVSVSPWYLRYYISGIKDAKTLAERQQQRKRQQVFTKMLHLLSENSN